MDNELEYIISSYASLKLNSQPLKDANLNSPAKLKPISPQKRSHISTNNPQEIHKLCMNSIDIVLKNFKSVKSTHSSFARLASLAFVQLYKIDILDKRKEVLKKHQTYILKLIELEDSLHGNYSVALEEIKAAHDRGVPSQEDPINTVLLGKSQVSLKFLVLQVLFRRFQSKEHSNSDVILKFFQNDCIVFEDLSSSQKNSLIKLILSFIRLSPCTTFKACLNLKFLQYLHQLNLEFKFFISNLSQEKFTQNLEKEIRSITEFSQIPIFLFSYLRVDSNETFFEIAKYFKKQQSEGVFPTIDWAEIIPDSGPSNNVMKLLSLPNINSSLICSELENLGKPTDELHKKLGIYVESILKSTTEETQKVILFYLRYTQQVNKQTSPVLDKIVMSSPKFVESPGFIMESFNLLEKLFIRHGQVKRLRNISNLFYNFALKLKSPQYIESFLQNCLRIELYLFQRTKSVADISVKFEKSLRCLLSQNISSEKTLKFVWNDEFLNSLLESELLHKIDVIDKYFGSIFQFYPFHKFSFADLDQENRAITFILCTKYSKTDPLTEFYTSLYIEEPTYQMLCGVFYNDVPFVKSQHPQSQPNIHSSPMIRSSYYLSFEIKTKSTSNITKILHLYQNSWLARNRESPTLFELHFLERFVDYLKFINFQKTLNSLLLSVEKYTHQNVDEFKDWFTYERLSNTLSLKYVLSLDVGVFDIGKQEEDFETKTDFVLRQLQFSILKLKYYLILYDRESLSAVALDIQNIIDANTDILDIKNPNLYTKKQFEQIITLLVKLHYYSSKLFKIFGTHMETVTSAKTCAQIARSLLKSKPENLQMLSYLSSSFRNLINTLIHLGASKDADYFVEEFSKFNESIMRFKMLYIQNSYFMCYYFSVTGRYEELSSLRSKSEKIFDVLGLIDEEKDAVDNYKLVFYHYLTEIYDVTVGSKVDTRQKLKKFLSFVEKEGKLLSNVWRLHYEYHLNSELIDLTINKSKDPYLHTMNYTINAKRLFAGAKRMLEIDPVFSTLEDSAMSIPSISQDRELPESFLAVKGKSKGSRNIKKSILDLRQSRNFILELFGQLKYLANYQLDEVHKIFALGLLTLSSISNSYHNESLDDLLNLGEFLKNNPFVNDKQLIKATSKDVCLRPNFRLDDEKSLEAASLNKVSINSELFEQLPEDWLVISIDICSFNGDLIISKMSKDVKTPRFLRLPLSRHSSRTIDEESFSFGDAMEELSAIIEESNRTTTKERTSSIHTAEDRQQWHQERFALDEKLFAFLNKIEYCWIGGFKGIFDQNKIEKDQRKDFKDKFLAILAQNVPSRSQRNQAVKPVEIDDFIIELFFSLGDPSDLMSTELLEDLIYFVLDVLLFHGEENAYDEIDIDNIYVEVEALIKEFLLINSNPPKYKHTILVVGKECQSIPWESLPSLRGSSTTRIPSLTMLLNLLHENERMVINKRNGSYIMNPSGDLGKTEERLKSHIEDLQNNLNWKGMSGKKPTEEMFEGYVQNSNLFVYIGHGGGEQFIKSTTLKKMEKAAPTLLLGCSSAALRDNNLLEPYGTVYSYLTGGCPMILGNLWDVTDKDIDKFSMSVFEKWGLSSTESINTTDISDAVRQSRDQCKLKYLNGAAPVVYGLPLSLL